MDAERWRRVDAIFAAALELPETERRGYIAAVCGPDRELIAEVASLLEADAPAAELFARPLGRLAGDEEPDAVMAQDARLFQHYRLQRVLGQSPSSRVYLAERENPAGQLVALKLLSPQADTASSRDRFDREKQIVAHLRHDHIARLFEAGRAEDGRPYLVLEYVEGLPIDLYCRRHGLGIPRRLELFQQVCSAVQHAHQNLLVHRDVKPANILVTPEGTPKLLDFGIAKSLHPQRFAGSDTTRLGQRPMTPRYASPEQIKGEPTSIATDIYSLGVLLYELLTDEPCYALASEATYELEQAICEHAPMPPSRRVGGERGRRLRGDLDTIVLKSLAKEVSGRYATVERFADDIRCHLEKRPVSAQRATWTYRARKLMDRHRAAVITSLVVAGLSLAFLAALVVQNRRISLQRQVAEQLRLQANDERREAEQAATFLIDLFRLANPNQNRGRELTAREILDAGAARIETALHDQPGLQAGLGQSMGQIYSDLGIYDQAASLLRLSLDRRQELYGQQDPSLAPSLSQLAVIYLFQGRYQAAEDLARDSLDRWRQIEDADPVEVATARNSLARALRHLGRASEAVAPLRQAVESLGKHPARAQSLSQLGVVLGDLDRFDEAQKTLEDAIGIAERSLGSEHPLVARHQLRLASVHNARGDAEGALAVAHRAAGPLTASLEPDHPLIAELGWEVGRAFELKGDLRAAAHRYSAALQIRRQRLGLDHPQVQRNAEHLEALMRQIGRGFDLGPAEPLSSVLGTVTADSAAGAAGDPLTSVSDLSTEISRLWQRLDAAQSERPKDPGRIAAIEASLGIQLLRMGRTEEAREHLINALSAGGKNKIAVEVIDGVLGLQGATDANRSPPRVVP